MFSLQVIAYSLASRPVALAAAVPGFEQYCDGSPLTWAMLVADCTAACVCVVGAREDQLFRASSIEATAVLSNKLLRSRPGAVWCIAGPD